MDNIEEIIDADVRDKAVEDMAAYKVGDVVWVIPENVLELSKTVVLLKMPIKFFIVFVPLRS